MIGYKKVNVLNKGGVKIGQAILTLNIIGPVICSAPKSKRPKLRTSKAFVKSAHWYRLNRDFRVAFRYYKSKINVGRGNVLVPMWQPYTNIRVPQSINEYWVGKESFANDFDLDPTQECSTGIHFFLSRKHAEDWT